MKQLNGELFQRFFLLVFVFCISMQTSFAQNTITLSTNIENNSNINNVVQTFTLKIEFDQPMNSGATISFSKNIDFAFTGTPTSSWSDDSKTYTIQYTVVGYFTETVYDVYAEFNGTTKGGDNKTCYSPTFHVDKVIPDCKVGFNVFSITPVTTGNFVITVEYNEEMDPAKKPLLSFNPVVTETLGTPISEVWSNTNKNYTVTYPIKSTSQQREEITVAVSMGYDKSGNEQNPQTGRFNIAMSNVVGVVNFVSNPDGGSHVNDQSNAFSVKVAYTGKMQESAVPKITFEPTVGTTLIGGTGNGWSDGSTVYTFNYTVTKSSQQGTIKATVSEAKDESSKSVENLTGTFLIDYNKPTCTITAPDISKPTTNYTVVLTYNEEMASDAPTITVSPPDAVAIFGASTGSWDATKKIYTANFSIIRTPPGVYNTAAKITVTGAKDLAGNKPDETSKTFIIDQRDIGVTAVMTPGIIQNSTTTATLSLTFNMDMDKTSTPKVIFSPDVQNTITPKANGATWVDNKTYTIEYNLDKTKKLEIKDIDITVSDAKNVNGEIMSALTLADVFTVNFLAPSCTISFSPEVILDETTTFKITLLYDSEMDVTSVPSITFGNFIDYALTFTNPQHAWEADKKTCIVSYKVVDKNEQKANILISADQAKSSTGNEQVMCDATKPLIVDMLNFIVTVDVNSPSINCNSSQLLVTVKFNQQMTETTNNIVSFPNFDPKGFLTFSKIEWTNNKEAVVEYSVHPDVAADNLAVDIAVASVKNSLGREYSGGTFSGKFSAKATDRKSTRLNSSHT